MVNSDFLKNEFTYFDMNIKITLLLFCLSLTSHGQEIDCFDPETYEYSLSDKFEAKICSSYLLDDFDELKDYIIQAHPNPYAYVSKHELDSAFKSAYSYFEQDRTKLEFAFKVNETLMLLKDPHTRLNVFDLMYDLAHYNSGFTPLFIRKIKDGFFVVSANCYGFEIGTEIISIDNIAFKRIHELSKNFTICEGGIGQAMEEEAADYYIPTLFFAMDNPEKGELKKVIYRENGLTDSTYIVTKGYKELQEAEDVYYKDFETSIESTFFLDQRKAILTIRSFSPPFKRKELNCLTDFFKIVNKTGINEIAIDIRNNGGGSLEFSEYLLSFFFPDGINTPTNMIWKASDLSYSKYSERTMKWFPKIIDRKNSKNFDDYEFFKATQTKKGSVSTFFYHDSIIQKNLKYVYNGKVSVFINGNTFSAATNFAQAIRRHNRGQLIGTPCNGSERGSFGNTALVKLGYTRIAVAIPTIRYNYDNSFIYSNYEIIPDDLIHQSLEDLKSRKDPFIEYFLKN